jgi:two-component system NarL family response regulator
VRQSHHAKKQNSEATIARASRATGIVRAKATASIGVLIAEDHHLVRAGLVAIINGERDMAVVGEAEDGRHALVAFESTRPDVVLMDLRMPDLDGVQTIEAIRRKHPEARIIVLTTFEGEEDIYRALSAGARGYLLKDVRSEELLSCIRDVHAGNSCVKPDLMSKALGSLHKAALTPRELQVLERMSVGLGNKQIASDLDISIDTIKSHVNSIFQKLKVGTRTEAVTIATKRGVLRSQ